MTADHEQLLAEGLLDDTDDAVLATLRRHLDDIDPVPAGLAERARFAMAIAALEAEVAEIIATTPSVAGVRSTPYDRATTMSFASGSLSAMVTIETDPDGGADLAGWTSEPGIDVELRERSRSRSVHVDGAGRFAFDQVERGLVHLVLRRLDDPQAPPVITPAFEI